MASKEAITITDLDANITYVSEHTVEMHGGESQRDFTGRNLIEFIAPEDREKALGYFKRAVSEGFVNNVEYKFLKLGGARFYGDISATIIKTPSGKPSAVMYAVRDLTKSKFTESALKITEDKYRILFDNANDAIFIHSMGDGVPGKFIEVNNLACSMMGYSKDELLSFRLSDIESPECRDIDIKAQEKLRKEKHAVYESCLIRSNGDKLLCEISSHSIGLDGMTVAVSIARDITRRKKAENELKESEEMYRSLIDVSPDAVFVMDTSGRIIYASDRALEMNGAPSLDLFVGRSVFDLITPADREKTTQLFNRVFTEGVMHGQEFSLLRYSGEKMTGEASARVLRGASGEIKGAIVTVRDITERKKIEEEARKSNAVVKKVMDGIINAMEKLVEKKDLYTVGHQHRTAQLAKAIAQEMGLPPEQVNCIYISALIHDIGKIFVSGSILNKLGPLTAEEYDIIKKHPEAGYEVLKTIDFPWPIADIILQHHERLDGSGYPYALKEDRIYLESRILAVADVVEAITFARPYRAAFGIDKALEEVVGKRGKQFDAEVVDICQELLKEKGFEFEKV